MKRDMALVRKILLWRSARVDDGTGFISARDLAKDHWFDGFDAELIGYHIQIMAEAGLVQFRNLSTKDTRYGDHWLGHLTWEGNDFLDAIANDSIFNNVMAKLKEKGLDGVFDLVKDLAVTAARAQLGLSS